MDGSSLGEPSTPKYLPFAESVEQLHRYNIKVAQHCSSLSLSQVQAYQQNKEKYNRQAQLRQEQRMHTHDEAEEARRKSIEGRHKE